MVCSFFGHRDATERERMLVRNCIRRLIVEEGFTRFYVGTHGSFDRIAYGELKKAKREHPKIEYTVVLAYLTNARDAFYSPEETLYPEGMERVPKRAAIVRRNHWMIDRADCVVVYSKGIGNSAALAEYARNRGKRVILLGEDLSAPPDGR